MAAPAPPTSSLVPVTSRIVSFDPATGQPVVRDVQVFTRAQVSEIAMAAASLPYSEPDDELALELGLPTSEFYGRPNLEVMLIKQARNAARSGDPDVIEKVLDRLIGKPKTTSENLNISRSYEDVLNDIAAREAQPVDAEVVA